MGSILFLLAFKLILLYLIYKAFLEMGIGFDSTLLLPKSERLFQSFSVILNIIFRSIRVRVSPSGSLLCLGLLSSYHETQKIPTEFSLPAGLRWLPPTLLVSFPRMG